MPNIENSIEKFQDLPIINQICFDNKDIGEKIEEINKEFDIDVFALIIFYATKDIAYKKIPDYLIKEFGLNEEAAKNIADILLKEIIKPVNDRINVLTNYTEDFNKDLFFLKNYVIEIFKKELINYLKEEDIILLALNRRILYLLAADSNFKVELERAMYNNNEILTKQRIKLKEKLVDPTIANWIKDFINYFGTDIFNNLSMAKYFTDTANASLLKQEEKNDFKKILLIYKNIKFFPESMPTDTGEGWQIIPLDDSGQEEKLDKARTVAGPSRTEGEKKIEELKAEKREYPEAAPESKAMEEEIEKEKELEQLKYMANKYPAGSLERRAIEEEIGKLSGSRK